MRHIREAKAAERSDSGKARRFGLQLHLHPIGRTDAVTNALLLAIRPFVHDKRVRHLLTNSPTRSVK